MDNNVIVCINSMRACTLYNISHENNILCLAIAIDIIVGALLSFYGEQKQKDRMNDLLL